MRSVVVVDVVTVFAAIHPPAFVDGSSQLGCIAFGKAGVNTLRGSMCMGTIAGPAQPLECRTRSRDHPGFLERCTRGARCTAD